jgi:molybdenum cofactor biosynthesis enzyme MoaA
MVVDIDRDAIIMQLTDRDGYKCTYPGCEEPFDPVPDSRHHVTVDHIYPQAKAYADGWTFDQVWDLSNLQLMGRVCNAKKSDRVYDEQGELGSRGRIRSVKVKRPIVCETCNSGRALSKGEVCEDCGSVPQPLTAPKFLQRSVKECDHDTTHCWMCYLDMIPRRSALSNIITGP